jgi:hypothetical protein
MENSAFKANQSHWIQGILQNYHENWTGKLCCSSFSFRYIISESSRHKII